MMNGLIKISCLAAVTFLSSCSCVIHNEHWKNKSKSRKITPEMIAEGMSGSGFKRVHSDAELVKYRKSHSFVEFTQKDQVILFHSSFCPVPWELLFGDESFREIGEAERRLVGSIQQRGLPLRKLSDQEVMKRYQGGE